ncbi:hypothetical protein GCM10011514_16950 [Emticicia aquatilis]|uniref:Uncharacterized protein n=1 Tax=Emticicia aquatilis TaxID=1537369 RepID=A0A916YNP3_9BACT|nr:hypothetical protein [Emticicia aquatilis]GGD53438.1 hypothetical protein GCM10011514_16950 [Emticicia aquatilis]
MNKNFETVKIREIDQETNDIMNEIGRENNLLTGSSIVIKGLKERQWFKMKYEAERDQKAIELNEAKTKIRQLENKVLKYQRTIESFKEFQQNLSEL